MDESNPKESHTPWYRTARQTEDLFSQILHRSDDGRSVAGGGLRPMCLLLRSRQKKEFGSVDLIHLPRYSALLATPQQLTINKRSEPNPIELPDRTE